VQISGLATSVPSMYRSMVKIKCATESPKGELVARTVLQIKWHPLPKFDRLEPISVAETASIGTILATIHPKEGFPFPLQYQVLPETSVINVSNEGTVTLASQLNFSQQREHNFDLHVFEVGRVVEEAVKVPLQIKVEVLVVENFQAAKFPKAKTGEDVQCNGQGVSLSVDLGSEKSENITFSVIGDLQECVIFTIEEGSASVKITEDKTKECGPTFAVAFSLTAPQSRDVIELRFSGCSGIHKIFFNSSHPCTDHRKISSATQTVERSLKITTSLNQSINQSINQSLNQSIDRSIT
jgi:hypothetical protein